MRDTPTSTLPTHQISAHRMVLVGAPPLLDHPSRRDTRAKYTRFRIHKLWSWGLRAPLYLTIQLECINLRQTEITGVYIYIYSATGHDLISSLTRLAILQGGRIEYSSVPVVVLRVNKVEQKKICLNTDVRYSFSIRQLNVKINVQYCPAGIRCIFDDRIVRREWQKV